ncbi:MAG TPA: cell wall hydrolase [Candidatus Dorea merdavium]|nr:cell wall hydrolase [Candidatus Dorea merdavium]
MEGYFRRMRGVDRRFRDMTGKRGKRYAAFLLFSAGVLSTAGFAQRTELFYPSRADEVIVLETLGQAQDVLLEGNLSGPAACRQLLASSGTVTEAGESVAAKEVFAAAKANANVGEGAEYSDSTLKLLASIIFCEAGNQPYEGQVAVGAVVMNRVRSDAFPDTVREVIYQKGQFTPAGSGWLDRVVASEGYTDSALQAAKDALAGANPIGDCLYFDQGSQGKRIGAHSFH